MMVAVVLDIPSFGGNNVEMRRKEIFSTPSDEFLQSQKEDSRFHSLKSFILIYSSCDSSASVLPSPPSDSFSTAFFFPAAPLAPLPLPVAFLPLAALLDAAATAAAAATLGRPRDLFDFGSPSSSTSRLPPVKIVR